LTEFVFETPFSLKGSGHAINITDQFKKRTLLTVDTEFPCTKKRIRVINKREIIVSPIENSIDLVESRTEALLSEIRVNIPNIKTLQPVLQGSVRLQVHSGAVEICSKFFCEGFTPVGYEISTETYNYLRASLKKFFFRGLLRSS